MIPRKISQHIKKDFFNGKIIVMSGARQVGKTISRFCVYCSHGKASDSYLKWCVRRHTMV